MADFFKEILTDIDKLSDEQVNQLMAALEVKRAGGQTTKDSIKENDEIPLACPHCGSISLKRHGKAGGRQRYRCKDCCKTFCETSQTLMHHSRLSPAQWKGLLLGMVQNLTLQEIANTINTSVTTVWFNKQKVCMTLEEAYRNYTGQFIDIVECDEYYTTVSFKGKRDPAFFINVLGRMPRHHMTLEEKIDYLSKHGLLEGLKKDPERLEMLCYFVMDKEYRGKCLVENCTYTNKTVVTEGSGIRPLNTFDLKEDEVFIRNQSDLSIILKVLEQKGKSISTTCSNVSPFGLKTTVDANVIRTSDTEVEIIKSYDETAYIERDEISKGIDLIDKYNVITGTLNADGGMALVAEGGLLNVINKPKILSPAQVCTLTYMVISSFDTMEQATNCAEYLKTKFIRFLISRLVGSAYMTYKQYRLVPLLDFSHPWTDQLLYEKYGLTQDEINHIETTIKPME